MKKKISEVNNLFFKITGCNKGIIDDKKKVYSLLNELSALFNSVVLKRSSKRFKPHGFTVCFFLSSSHLIYSSWPEYNAVLLEISTCSQLPPLNPVRHILKRELGCSQIEIKKMRVKLI